MCDRSLRVNDADYSAHRSQSSSRLDNHINPSVDYTRHDEAITSLKEVITCIILLDTSDSMIVFNNQFYDATTFEQYRSGEDSRNRQRAESGYGPSHFLLKEPRTGRNFQYNHAIDTLYHTRMTQVDMCDLIMERIPTLSLGVAALFYHKT